MSKGAERVATYSHFEKTKIQGLQRAVPDLRPELEALVVAQKISPEERGRVRQDLLNYCERDTWAMVKVLERLRELARPPAAR